MIVYKTGVAVSDYHIIVKVYSSLVQIFSIALFFHKNAFKASEFIRQGSVCRDEDSFLNPEGGRQ